MFKSLGIDWLEESMGEGREKRCRVKSAKRNDIYTYSINDSASQFFTTNYIWDLCDR